MEKEMQEKSEIKRLMDELQQTKDDLQSVINCIDWLKNILGRPVEEPMIKYGEKE